MSESPIYRYAAAAYQLLEEAAELNEYQELIFTGKLAATIRRAGGSSTYYSKIRELLDSPMGDPCIEVRTRGAGVTPSVVVLRHPPPEEWAGLDLTSARATAKLSADSKTEGRLRVFLDEIGGMNIREILIDFESRLSQLEQERDEREERQKAGLSGTKAKAKAKAKRAT